MPETWKEATRRVLQEDSPKDMKAVKETYAWKKVEAPKRWNPIDPGEELCGFYVGKTTRSGAYGQYEVVLIHVPGRGTLMASGVRIVQLVDASGVEPGWPVRLVWRGLQPFPGTDKRMKLFEFFVAEGEPMAPESLPKIKVD